MIETTILDWLNAVLDVPAYMERPIPTPARWVLVQKTGSGVTDHVKRATVAVQSYAPTLYAAAQLNEAVKSAMDALIELDGVSRSHLNSDYEYTDPTKKQHRYQAVYDITYY